MQIVNGMRLIFTSFDKAQSLVCRNFFNYVWRIHRSYKKHSLKYIWYYLLNKTLLVTFLRIVISKIKYTNTARYSMEISMYDSE